MQPQIIFNGVTYNSIDDMPPDARAQYEALGNLLADKNQNGVPDLVDGAMQNGATVIQTSAIVYQGKTYARPDDLPPEARVQYQQAMVQLADSNQNGTPDILENTDAAAPIVVTTTELASPDAALPNTQSQGLGPIVVLTVVALGLTAIILILMFLLFGRAR